MTTIFGGNTSGGYEVDNSVRLFSNTLMTMTPSGAPTNADISTLSFWTKLAGLGTERSPIFAAGNGGGVHFRADTDQVDFYNGGGSLRTTQKFKDVSAWYHIVLRTDTTDGTANDRLRVYVNGTQVTDFAQRTNPDQNANTHLGSAVEHHIGCNTDAANFFNGYLAEVCFIDGLSLGPDSFGEFDGDSPTIWKPINVSGLTYGNNGFYLEFKSGGNLGDEDKGTQTADWSETNLTAVDQSTDTCTNNFCTMNPVLGALYTPTFSEGNLQVTQSTDNQHAVTHGTFAVTKGVWYWEVKYIGNTGTSGPSDRAVGIQVPNVTNVFTQANYNTAGSILYYGYDGGEIFDEGTSTTADYGTYSQNSILGISLDMDNSVISFYINGNEVVDNYALGSNASVIATPAVTWPNGTASGTEMGMNFGSPFYALSSAVADANGHGAFEYTPVGFALCTKNLAEFG